jgi:acyl-CoA hydrolase
MKVEARGKSPEESLVRMTELVLPQHANALQTVFGGVMMSWIDIAAAIAAGRHSARTCVTASIDQLHFRRPIRTGYVVNIEARVTFVHNTSCEVMVNVNGENPTTGETFNTAVAFLTFVALNDEGRPVPMPPLKPRSDKEKILMAQGELRRKNRVRLKKTLDRAAKSGNAPGKT